MHGWRKSTIKKKERMRETDRQTDRWTDERENINESLFIYGK